MARAQDEKANRKARVPVEDHPGIFLKGRDYCLDYRDAAGRRIREKIGPSLKLAETILKKRMVEKAEGKFLDIRRPGKTTLKEFIPKYLDYCKANKRPNTYIAVGNAFKKLAEFFGGILLHEITPDRLEAYKQKRLQNVSPSTVNRETAYLRAMLNIALKWGKLQKNPLGKVKMMKEPPGRVKYLTHEQIQALLENCSHPKAPHLRPIVICALLTGMRKGEILALRWKDIDTRKGLIHVEDSKNGERRDIPICEELRDELLELPKDREYVFGKFDNVSNGFLGACRRAGIEDFTFHDLRHTFASHLVMGGTPILVVKELLGHKTLAMTLRYAHLAPKERKTAVDNWGSSIGHFLDTSKSFD